MTQITLNIPDQKLDFFLELFEHLGLETQPYLDTPEEHKQLVLERIRTASSEQMLSWKQARKQLTFKK